MDRTVRWQLSRLQDRAMGARDPRVSAARLGAVGHLAEETARACALIDAALTVRRGLRELPKHDRPLIARLVA